MYEVELKFRADHRTVRTRLDELGADPLDRVTQADTYYDAPHRDFAATDEALRIRRETPHRSGNGGLGGDEGDESDRRDAVTRGRLTYKGPLVEDASKTRLEAETGVESDEATARILDGLGFEPAAVVEKERERFALEGYTVTLDSVTGLGQFVEVEREADEDRIEPVREGATALARDLGLDPDEGIRTSYLGMLLADDLA